MDGVMFEWRRHFARMKHDAAKMRVPFPPDAAWLEERLYRLIRANKATNATLRVNIVRNHGGLFQDTLQRRISTWWPSQRT